MNQRERLEQDRLTQNRNEINKTRVNKKSGEGSRAWGPRSDSDGQPG